MSNEKKKEVLVVLDIETTGLDTKTCEMLELAFIVVEEETLEEIGRFSSIVAPPTLDLINMHPDVVAMHKANGLFDEILALDSVSRTRKSLGGVEAAAITTLARLAPRGTRRILTGNSVHFDKAFLEARMPELAHYFHYGVLDVSSARRALRVERSTPKEAVAHRAMADCEMSLAELKALRAAFNAKGATDAS